jgi:hypothetical protein
MTEEFKIPMKLFELGRIVATPGAMAACSRSACKPVSHCISSATGSIRRRRITRPISTRCFPVRGSPVRIDRLDSWLGRPE